MKNKWIKGLLQSLSYVLVAALSSCITLAFFAPQRSGIDKLSYLQTLITQCFIGEVSDTQLLDGAAAGMVSATGDRWSYYIPASQYSAHMEQMNNRYVGIGVTVGGTVTEKGLEILRVEETGGAAKAGIQPGDFIYKVEGETVYELGNEAASGKIKGETGTKVTLTLLRGEEELEVKVMRSEIAVAVAGGSMLNDTVGYVWIANFDERCAQETVAAVEAVLQQGAQKIIFDVRNNPGGYKHELTQVLDYLLPEGEIFHTVDYQGNEEFTTSDAECLDIPMAVLINRESYSAAEFFAAALDEYDKAVLVGEQTVGKGYFQMTHTLGDGSAVGLSVGKYYTPKGVSLAETGGLTPEVPVEVNEETYGKIYAKVLEAKDDPQIQAAIKALS